MSSFLLTLLIFFSLFLKKDERLCFHHKPLRLNLGTVKTPYHSLALQIRTAIDCVDQLKEAWDEGITKVFFTHI